MYLVELFERGKGTSFVARTDTREAAFHAAREDASKRYSANIEGDYASLAPRYDGAVFGYRVVGRKAWYTVYIAEVVEG